MDHLPSEEAELVAVLDLDLLVQRQYYSRIHTLSVEFDRKASHNISKSACLNKWYTFRSYKQNIFHE